MKHRILSLGAGVQSSTVLLMSYHGLIEPFDYIIFADTGWEPSEVYAHLEWLKLVCARNGQEIHIVRNGDLRADVLAKIRTGSRCANMPLFTQSFDGTQGRLRRQCTKEYKLYPVDKFIRSKVLELEPRKRIKKNTIVEFVLGISLDEKQRCTLSYDKWREHDYPLVFDLKMTRHDCLMWLKKNYPNRSIPRSSCVGCPNHSNTEWRRLRDTLPAAWADAVVIDRAIRNSKMGGMADDLYFHRDLVPLDKVDLSTPEDRGQGNMFETECAGMCGV